MKLNKLREEMAQSFIGALKEDRIPWEQGWQSQDRPRNAVSDYSYKGINNLWLSFIAGEKGYHDPRWCTFQQAQSQGWKVRKGEKGSRVEFWSLYDTKDKKKITQEEVKKIRDQLTDVEFQERIKPVSNVYTVFNAEQIEGIPELEEVRISFSAEELINQRDVLLKNMNVDFHEGGDRAFYRPGDDSITLPFVESFQDAYAYMATFLHEAGHATGHESRLDRPVRNTFGSPAYAKEELRAEIASAFTGQALGIDGMNKEHLDNHKAYIQSWIKTLENNPGELYAAIRDAEKISDYLIEKGEFDLDSRIRERNTDPDLSRSTSTKIIAPDKKLYDVSLYDNQKAASIRLAIKGRESGAAVWKNDIGYQVGLAASEYLDQGMGIQEVIANHLKDIDAQCLIGDPAYTKNILSSVYAHNTEEYDQLNGVLNIDIPEDLLEVSEQLAGRLAEAGIDIYAKSGDAVRILSGQRETAMLSENQERLYVSQAAFEQREDFFPTVQCRLSDLPAFEEGKIYTVSEFNSIMEVEDRLFFEKKQELYEKYKDYDGVTKAIAEGVLPKSVQKYIDWQQVDFTIWMKTDYGQQIEDCQDIGNGWGNLLEFVEKNYYKQVVESLQEEMDVNTQFLDRIEYERSHHSVRNIDDGMMKISRPLAEKLAEDGIYVYVKQEDSPGQTSGRRAADLQELQELFDQASGETSLYVSSETLEYLEKYGCRKETMERLHKEMGQSLSASQFDPAAFVSEHQEKLDCFDGSQSTQIINLFGGPGSGKTTCAMSICSELKKLGYSAEYVQEYAKELVYEKNFDLLDGSEMHQFEILQEQMHRVDRLLGGDVDFIVCDAPIVLNGIYNQELTAEYSGMLQDLFAQYQNMSFFIERDVTSYQQEGRMQTFQESVEKDAEIRNMLDSYGISWDSCTHEMLDQIIHKAVEQHQQLVQEADRSPHSIETASQSDNLMKVSEQLAGRLLENGMDVYVKTEDPTNREKFNKVADLKELSVLDQGSASLYVSQAAFEQREAFFPTVQCRLSESLAFEEGKTYTVSEFDSMMELEDRLFLEKKFELLKKYKDFDGVSKGILEDGLPGNSLGYMGYHKVDFTIQMKNQKIEERQDIGDGDGSLLEFLEKSGYKGIIESLQEEMNAHTEFLSYQEKLHDVWDNLDNPSGIEERSMHLQEQNNTFRMSAKQGIPGRGSAKGVVPIGR